MELKECFGWRGSPVLGGWFGGMVSRVEKMEALGGGSSGSFWLCLMGSIRRCVDEMSGEGNKY